MMVHEDRYHRVGFRAMQMEVTEYQLDRGYAHLLAVFSLLAPTPPTSLRLGLSPAWFEGSRYLVARCPQPST